MNKEDIEKEYNHLESLRYACTKQEHLINIETYLRFISMVLKEIYENKDCR